MGQLVLGVLYLPAVFDIDHSSTAPQPSPPLSHLLIGIVVVVVLIASIALYRARKRKACNSDDSPISGSELPEGSTGACSTVPPRKTPYYQKTFWAWSRIWGGALGAGLITIPVGIGIHSLAMTLSGVGMTVGGATLAAIIYHYSPPGRE